MIGNPLLLPGEGYQISRSVRLRSSATAYFNRTPASAGNRQKWTWSGWVKAMPPSATNAQLFSTPLVSAGTNSTYLAFASSSLALVSVISGANSIVLVTSAAYRDPSAWYHIVAAVDTTDATASNRAKLYVNGVQVTAFSTATYPAQNANTYVNNNAAHHIGAISVDSVLSQFFDGYLTEVNFIDGQALTPASFGETDAITGVWKPKKYGGTYGTNGFYLNFSDPSAATAAAIGKDYSGNGNNWTPNNISVTAGVTYDSMLDVPTPYSDGGNGRGNYAVLNPLNNAGSRHIISQGNLAATLASVADDRMVHGTIFSSTGKWYFEYSPTVASSIGGVGIAANNAVTSGGGLPQANSVVYFGNGVIYRNAVSQGTFTTFTTNDVIGVAFDLDALTVAFYKNGTLVTTVSSVTADAYSLGAFANNTGDSFVANFGQRPFSYTPPTGFKALNTQNLPEPTIKLPNKWFDATLYTGTNANQTVVNAGGFQPDLVWGKSRSQIRNHNLYDSVRGAGNMLLTNGTTAELTGGELTGFVSNGFTLGPAVYQLNNSGDSMVAWQWKKGATPGFDIVTYTGNGANRTIAHSLGVAPSMMIFKVRTTTNNWLVYHRSVGATGYLLLDSTAATATSALAFNNTAPTSTDFTLSTGGAVNANTQTYVAYLFSEVAGFSKFGSYTGNGSSDGPFVFCGFRPRWLMTKRTDSTGSWLVVDSARNTYNVVNGYLVPNTSDAEGAATWGDFTSNGFKLRGTTHNGSSETYIFAAFAETPQKFSLAR